VSIRLIVEVLDHWKDFGLTAGERNDLIVVAENANEQTRETVGPLHEEYILDRAGKSAAGWKNALGKLMGKKALEYAVRNGREMRGHSGQYAVYRIPDLCSDAPHDGWRGHCTRPERVTSQVTQHDDENAGKGHLSDDPIDEKGHLRGGEGSPERCEWVTPEVTPTPLTPTTPTTSSAARDSATVNGRQQKKSKPPAAGPIPGDAPHLDDVEAICNHLADAIQKLTNERPTITKRDWRDPARLLLDKDGRTFEQILTAIDWAHGDAFWQGVITNPKALRNNYAKLRQKAAAERRKPGAYQNPDDQSEYDESLI
jgi:hypothetical protein